MRIWLKVGLAAAMMKSWKNSWQPGKDGAGQGPPTVWGAMNLSNNLANARYNTIRITLIKINLCMYIVKAVKSPLIGRLNLKQGMHL